MLTFSISLKGRILQVIILVWAHGFSGPIDAFLFSGTNWIRIPRWPLFVFFFFFFFHTIQGRITNTEQYSYNIPAAKGENQQKWIGSQVANLATVQGSLTTTWGTQNISQWKPEADKKFRSASLVLSCQSEAVFILKVSKNFLLSVRYKTRLKP